ncbi:MAG: hypothetical protein HY815_31290, partial [Candidatus Riflebacteria bacterium]|nr:hypothetical protein [Candidatus Riflebacteria bacterium]
MTFEAIDPRGNKVFREEVKVSSFGVAAATLRLADMVNEGEYRLRATVLAPDDPGGGSAAREVACAQEKTVTVKPYVLPKFKVELATDRPFYRPGETIEASVTARYFFGKPVGGTAELELAAFTAGFAPAARARARLSPEGKAQVRLPLPAVLAGLETHGGRAVVLVKARVTDLAGHPQEVSRTLTVSPSSVAVEAIPEAGKLVPGVENIVWVLVARPDGTPLAGATVRVEGSGLQAVTDVAGVAEVRFVPSDRTAVWNLAISAGSGVSEQVAVKLRDSSVQPLDEALRVTVSRATDAGGKELIRVDTVRRLDGSPVRTRVHIPALSLSSDRFAASHDFSPSTIPESVDLQIEDETGQRATIRQPVDPTAPDPLAVPSRLDRSRPPGAGGSAAQPAVSTASHLLLRTDDAIYKVGDTARLTVLSSDPSGTAYLDIVREGQTLATRTLELTGGRSELALDLSQDLAGTLRLHAYRVLDDGSVARSGKVIVVGSARGLSVTVRPDKASYLPGEKARVDFEVKDGDGKPVAAVLGVDIVDESVFALADFAPGLERVYFAIEQELMSPKYQLKCVAGGLDVGREVRRRWCEDPKEARDVLSRIARVLLAPIVPEGDLSVFLASVRERRQALIQLQRTVFFGLLDRLVFFWMPLTLAVLLGWILLRGLGPPGVPDVEPGSKQEAQFARVAWAGSSTLLVAAVAATVLAGSGGVLAASGGLLVLVFLIRFLAVWSSPESRAHLPPGPMFHGGSMLLFAFGAEVAAALLCVALLEPSVAADGAIAILWVMVAPVISVGAYTCQVADLHRGGRRGFEGGEGLPMSIDPARLGRGACDADEPKPPAETDLPIPRLLLIRRLLCSILPSVFLVGGIVLGLGLSIAVSRPLGGDLEPVVWIGMLVWLGLGPYLGHLSARVSRLAVPGDDGTGWFSSAWSGLLCGLLV